jgi:hypothetical protein
MQGGEGEDTPEHDQAETRPEGVAGQVWVACALCGRTVELADTEQTVEGHVCPDCAQGSSRA